MASYPPPNNQNGSIFNPIDWIEPNAGSIDTAYLNEHYCQFPVAQGSMSFAGINNTGTTTIKQNIVMTGTANVNYIEFPDTTRQYTAVAGSDILNDPNNWSGVNNFNPLPVQTYGATMEQGITLTNNQSSSTTTGDSSIVSYTPTTTTGLEIYSLSSTNNCNGVSPQIQLKPDGTQSKISASATNGLVVLAAVATGGLIQLNANTGVRLGTFPILDFNSWGKLSSTSSTSGIKSDVNFSAPSLIIDDGVNNAYSLRSEDNFGFIVANTDGLGSLTISNNSTNLTTLRAENNNLNISTPISTTSVNTPEINQTANNTDITIKTSGTNSAIVLDSTSGVSIEGNQVLNFPSNGQISADSTGLTSTVDLYVKTQPVYSSSTVYGNKASTQAFVQSAISGQGGGDASLSANQTFTGLNTFTKSTTFSSITNPTSGFSIGSQLRLTLDTGPTFLQSYYTLNSDGTTTYSNIVNLPSQTYDGSVSYGNVASTQQFVIQAISSQGGGDVYLDGTNNFTGTNTFNTNLPSSTIGGVYPNYGTPNSFATIGYVNSLTTTINSVFSGNLGVASIGYPNFMTSHLVGNIIYYNGYIAFVPSGNPSKVTFNVNPALNITLQTLIQNASLYSVDTSSYISIDASQTYLFNNALIIQLYGGLGGGTYNFQFSGNAQYS